MDDSIGGVSPTPEDPRAEYKQDFSKSVDLFQKSLDGYQSSQIPKQQAMYKDVMERTLQIMNETAKLCLSKSAPAKKKPSSRTTKTTCPSRHPKDCRSSTTTSTTSKRNSELKVCNIIWFLCKYFSRFLTH